MSELRADGASLILHESAPFGRLYSYRSTQPVEAMLAPDYFGAESGRLRAGDEIKLVQIAGEPGAGRVADFAICLVIETSRRGVILESFARRDQGRATTAAAAADRRGRRGGREVR